MDWKTFFSIIFVFLVVGLLGTYWFIPTEQLEFSFVERNNNFTLQSSTEGIQFYENMRFPTNNISYRIEKCTIQKESEMERAFSILEEETILNFYSVDEGEEIYVTCDSETRLEGGLFIAGEGGPSNITQSGGFNVIKSGKILLLRESKCERPNVAIHELLHVLGFDHSENENNIMYPVNKCSQTIGDDTIIFLNDIYDVPSQPDLIFQEASASREGTYVDVNFTVRNYGLADAKESEIIIYADDEEIKTFESGDLEIGEGRLISLDNIIVFKKNINQLKFEIVYDGKELDKINNVAILEIKE
jgi:hypothetical protein